MDDASLVHAQCVETDKMYFTFTPNALQRHAVQLVFFHERSKDLVSLFSSIVWRDSCSALGTVKIALPSDLCQINSEQLGRLQHILPPIYIFVGVQPKLFAEQCSSSRSLELVLLAHVENPFLTFLIGVLQLRTL